MFQPWKTDMNIIKAVFKLHFNVTQMLQSGVEALVLSIVPEDNGKPSTRLEDAKVNGGVCTWENLVYETVNLVQEPKTGKFNERIYHFMLSNGLSTSSSIGIASIDFAEYVEATKPSSISLPIKNSHCDAVLHVSIERIQEKNDKREEEECVDADLKPDDKSLCTDLSNGDIEERTKSDSSENVSAKSNTNRAELRADRRTSSGSDITVSSSDVNSGLYSPRDGLRNTSIHLRANTSLSDVSYTSEPEKPTVDALVSMYDDIHKKSHLEWFAGSELGSSADYSTNVSPDALPKEGSQQASDIEIKRLKAELSALVRRVEMSDLELQTLRKQVVKESKRRHELSKEIIGLKEERNALKTECDNLRSSENRSDEAKVSNSYKLESGDLRTLVEQIRQELNYEKDLNANLKLQLKETQKSKAELIHAVQDLDDMLKHKNKEILNLSNKYEQSKNSHELDGNRSKCETNDVDHDQKGFEELVEQRNNSEKHLLEKKIAHLYGEIEMCRREKDELEMQMEQIALDYEILKQESHGIACKLEQSQLEDQLKMQYECSSPPSDIDEFENHIERIDEDMEKQAQGFKADLDAVMRDKVEQEQRAIRAEEALRKNRQKNANTADKLQEELRRLSVQMVSTFDPHENPTMGTLTEASELHSRKILLEEILHEVKEEPQSINAGYEVKLNELSNQIEIMSVQMQQMSLEIEDKSKLLENQKHEEQVSRDIAEEIQMIKAENERLKADISSLSEKLEQKESLRTDLELMKKSVEESETLLQRGMVERNELTNTIASLKKEAEQLVDELNRTRHVFNEKETVVRLLQSELEELKAQHCDLIHSLIEDEADKDKLGKQVLRLKGELKKDDGLTNIDKRLKDSNGHTQRSHGIKTVSKNRNTASIPRSPKEMTSLKEKVKVLEGTIKTKETSLVWKRRVLHFWRRKGNSSAKFKNESKVED
ncbi:hypothetical protein Lal_00041479 [Lupinus albus]|uniref:Putative EEIG1/EHBP1 domain-containing protein n=1 Tax=Lupinus albus TaxID=3870 RepID=A0A6A5MNI8_LUPAL|nr:putative EEIG1/EHBP1 domain-containing protein [Lupinus albus]KAF1874038.1 hypothetical protein Lal_00041479 [Lupinus albus]